MYRLLLSENTVQTGNSITASGATAFASVVPIFPTNADSLSFAGRGFSVKCFGYLTTAASTPGTVVFTVLLGTTVIGTSATYSLPTSLTSAAWMMDLDVQVETTGTSGTVSCQGFVTIDNAGVAGSIGIVNTGTAVSGFVTVNTQTQNNLSIKNNFSAGATNTIVMTKMRVIEV